MNDQNQKGLAAFLGMAFGAVGGWIVGYIVVMSRCAKLAPFAEAVCSMAAPRAGDAILFGIFGGIAGLIIGLATAKDGEERRRTLDPRDRDGGVL